MNATNVHTNAFPGAFIQSLMRRAPAWAGIGLVLGALFASTSSAVVSVSFWRALPPALLAVFLNLLIMLPLLYGGIVFGGIVYQSMRNAVGGTVRKEPALSPTFQRTLWLTAPAVLLAQVPAGMLNTVLIEGLFPYMMLASWWLTFAMLTGTALAVCCLAIPLTIHYEHIRGRLLEKEVPQAESAPGLWIPDESGRRLVRYKDILYMTSRGHVTIIHTTGRDYKRSILMKQLGTHLPADDFLRVHKSHMLNLKRVDRLEYFMGGAYIAFLNDEAETEVPVGRTYAAALKAALGLKVGGAGMGKA